MGKVPNRALSAKNFALFQNNLSYHQPGCWLRCAPLKQGPLLDTDLHYAFDYDLMIRFLSAHPDVRYVNQTLAYFRMHLTSKTGGGNHFFEVERRKIWQRILLLSNDRQYSKKIKAQIERSIENERWRKTILRASEPNRSRFTNAMFLTFGILGKPQFRLNRFTLGAIRKLLFR